MKFHQPVEEVMSEVLCHMLKRANKISLGDQLAIGQEYKEWIKYITDKELAPQKVLFINTSTFRKKFI